MFKNRFALTLMALSMLLVTLAVSEPFSKAPKAVYSSQPLEPVIVPVTGDNELSDYHQRHTELSREETPPLIMDSATRSYIAWGEALEAAGKLHDLGACSIAAQEKVFERINPTLDSATRSYIAWGLALQAKDDIRAACR